MLLIASLFSRYAAGYELIVNLVICLAAVAAVYRAFCSDAYFWAAGFIAIAVVFSPLALAAKIFLLMGFSCAGAFAALVTAFRKRPVLATQASE